MQLGKPIDIRATANDTGIYVCAQCSSLLFKAATKFDAGCGFPSFWKHIEDNVKYHPLSTYGRNRIQLLCNQCDSHLGHLFQHDLTPTGVRYCIHAAAICYVEKM